MKIKIFFVVCMMLLAAPFQKSFADDTPNSRQARRIFNTAYEQVFGET